jgi:hypothetical protein
MCSVTPQDVISKIQAVEFSLRQITKFLHQINYKKKKRERKKLEQRP